jgi:nucleotide-binding universal stress UspA family protein
MKTILVPIHNIVAMRSALETAALLAKQTAAYIEGFPLRFSINQFVVSELATGFSFDSYQATVQKEMADMRRSFEAFMLERDIAKIGTSLNQPTFGWLDNPPEGEEFVGSHGRAFDVTVMSRSDVDAAGAHRRAVESALFESGRPVLLSPPDAPKSIAKNVMIHWNGSTEQARVNAFAMPLLRLAERVTVLSVVGGQEVPGPSADQIVGQLQHNDIAAKLIRVELQDRSTGEAVLDATRAQGCDLLVKGAFTRNRLRQMIFGGATSHIMEHADLPVLMAH